MDEKEFDEKYKRYFKEANDEIRPKLQEKTQQMVDKFQKSSKSNKENYKDTKEYITSSLQEYDEMIIEAMKINSLKDNSINKRILKKFLVNK